MAMNKKAIFFSLMAILLISIILLSAKPQFNVTLVNRVPVIESRVYIANSFVTDVNTNYLDRVLYVSGTSALNSYIKNITTEKKYDSPTDFQRKMRELMINGTLDNSVKKYNNNTIQNLLNNISNLAESSLLLDVSFNIGDSQIFQSSQTGPWKIGFNMSFSYFVNASIAQWNVSKNITSMISLIGFEDPLFLINTSSSLPSTRRYIQKTDFVNWNVTNLEIFINSSKYKYDEESPSFIGRLTNDLSSSECCGIQSFINSSDAFWMKDGNIGGNLTDHFRNVSFVDYCYLGADTPICNNATWEVVGISTDSPDPLSNYTYPFRIEPYHMAKFNLTETLGTDELYKD